MFLTSLLKKDFSQFVYFLEISVCVHSLGTTDLNVRACIHEALTYTFHQGLGSTCVDRLKNYTPMLFMHILIQLDMGLTPTWFSRCESICGVQKPFRGLTNWHFV